MSVLLPSRKRCLNDDDGAFWDLSDACRPADVLNLPVAEDYLIVDTRSANAFSFESLPGARNLPQPLMAAVAAGQSLAEYVAAWVDKTMDEMPPEQKTRAAVLGDSEVETEENELVLSAVERAILNHPRLENSMLCVLRLPRGHSAMIAEYPFLVIHASLPFYPCHVEPYVFIGSSMNAKSKQAIQDLQIKAVLNTGVELPNFHEGTDIAYMKVPFRDDPDQELAGGLADALSFIKDHVTAGRRILVHCHQGQSRSAAVVVAYLMASRGCGFDRALALLRRARPFVRPNFGFELELKQLEGRLISEGLDAQLKQ